MKLCTHSLLDPRFLRWHALSLLLASLSASLFACNRNQLKTRGERGQLSHKTDKSESIQNPSTLFDQRRVWLKKSRALSKTLGSRLQTELRRALAKGDPALAVQTCATVAPKLSLELSKIGEYEIKRVSLKPRNSGNRPNPAEQEILASFEKENRLDPSATLESLEQTKDGQLRYMSGIRIKPLCLTCHGNNVSLPLLQEIKRLYPSDQATGYKTGDVRGAFLVKWTLSVPSGLNAPNLRAPKLGLVTGGAPSSSDISKLRDLGFSLVVDLRHSGESPEQEGQAVRKAGVRYIHLPIRGSKDVSFEKAQKLRVFLNQETTGRTFLHCATGNRVGALLALIAFKDGASVDAALAQGRAAGMTSLEPKVHELLLAARRHR